MKIIVALAIVFIFFMGRWCKPVPEDPQIALLELDNERLQDDVISSDLRVDSINGVVQDIQKSNRRLFQENTLKDRQIINTVQLYEDRIVGIQNFTVEQIDSFYVDRFPNVIGPDLDREIIEDLIERDGFEEIVTIQKQKIDLQMGIISNQGIIIASLNSVIAEKDLQLENKDQQLDNKDQQMKLERKKNRKLKWQRNGGLALAAVFIILNLIK